MNPRHWLRIEGLAVFGAALATYIALDGPIWLLLVLALAPDLSMIGYLGGNRVGAAVYNAAHVYVLPLVLGGFGVWFGAELAVLGAVVWMGHIGADRLFGYGVKDERGFGETHLSRVEVPAERPTGGQTGPHARLEDGSETPRL